MTTITKPLFAIPYCTPEAEALDLARSMSRTRPVALVRDPSTKRRYVYIDREEFPGMEVLARYEYGQVTE